MSATRVIRGLNLRIRIGLAAIVVLAVLSFILPTILGVDARMMAAGPALGPPDGSHWFGLDSYGRDQLARTAEGVRLSLMVGSVVAGGALLVGIPIGLVTAYLRGPVDAVVARLVDVLFAFPSLLLALFFVAVMGSGMSTAVIALVVIYIPIAIRFVRNAALAEVQKDYVTAARVSRAGLPRICFLHILPNIWAPVLVLATSIFAFAILAEAALSYLGVGAKPPTASLGRLLTENQGFITTNAYLELLPAVVLSLVILSINLIGDGLRDQVGDGRRQRVKKNTATIDVIPG